MLPLGEFHAVAAASHAEPVEPPAEKREREKCAACAYEHRRAVSAGRSEYSLPQPDLMRAPPVEQRQPELQRSGTTRCRRLSDQRHGEQRSEFAIFFGSGVREQPAFEVALQRLRGIIVDNSTFDARSFSLTGQIRQSFPMTICRVCWRWVGPSKSRTWFAMEECFSSITNGPGIATIAMQPG